MAAGANQQLIVSKIETALQAPAPAPPIAQATINEGAMAIPHQEPPKKEETASEEKSLPDVNLEEDSSIQQIKIDDQGNLHTMDELKKAGSDRMALHPPTLGGTLTANSRPEELEPSTDPLSSHQENKILTHGDTSTLTDIEKSVNSPHVNGSGAPAGAMPAHIDNARSAVDMATASSENQRLEPIKALGASPLDMNVQNQDSPNISQPMPGASPQDILMPTPQPSVMPAAPNEDNSITQPSFMQDKGIPPEDTGTAQPPTSPPPVPPPMMPPSYPQ